MNEVRGWRSLAERWTDAVASLTAGQQWTIVACLSLAVVIVAYGQPRPKGSADPVATPPVVASASAQLPGTQAAPPVTTDLSPPAAPSAPPDTLPIAPAPVENPPAGTPGAPSSPPTTAQRNPPSSPPTTQPSTAPPSLPVPLPIPIPKPLLRP